MLTRRIVRSGLAVAGVVGVLLGGSAVLMAQNMATTQAKGEPTVTLKPGDKAPPLSVEKWLKGEPIKQFEPGKVYVVEFWATWCTPCVASMPHLSAMQKEYKDQGVTFIGVNIWEDVRPGSGYSSETLKKVEDFVKTMGERMRYTVAYDGKEKASAGAYMRAAGLDSIPHAFVIDKQGTIVWIGHPMWLDLVIEPVLAGKWDIKTGPQAIDKVEKRLEEIDEKNQSSPKDALAAFDNFQKDYPKVARLYLDMKFGLLLSLGEIDAAYKLGAQLTDEAIANYDPIKLNTIAWFIVDPQAKLAKRDLDLAMKAALKADELTNHEDPVILDTLARVYFSKGDVDKAIELQTKVVELVKGPEKADVQKSLDEYKQAKEKK